MRGSDERSGELFSYIDIEERVPQNHPLRASHDLHSMQPSAWSQIGSLPPSDP